MNSVGAEMRQERERQGLSLHEVSESTRITVQNLEAIEEDRFESFPNRVYARAFLRDYSNFLGLDSQGLLERYEETRAEVAAPEPEQAVVTPRRGWRTVGYVLILILVAGVLAGGGYVGWRLYDESVETARESRSEARRTEHAEPPPAPVPPQPETPVTVPAVETEEVPGQNTLTITALDTVWVHLDVDGRRELYANLSKGTTRTYHPENKAFLHVGRANAVLLDFNGESITLGVKRIPAKWSYP